MRIAMLTSNYKPFVGGVPISVERLAEGLRRQGHTVFVFAPEDTCGVGRTESSPRKLGRLYEEGYYQAKESMHALRLYLNN